MSDPVYEFEAGDGPLLISMPHVGQEIPGALAGRMTGAGRELADTDWHVDRLYDFCRELGASVIRARYSRYVVDLNRDPGGSALYPGQSETEICPTTSFGDQLLYRDGETPTSDEVAERVERYWRPYHKRLRAELDRLRQKYGVALLWDAHSIKSRVPQFFEGTLPDLNLGTGGGVSCAPEVAARLLELGQKSPYKTVLNGRFKGGYITRHYGDPARNIHAIQMEIAQASYMREEAPYTFLEDRAQALRPVLKDMLRAYQAFFVSRS